MSVRRELASGVFYTSIAKYAGIVVTLMVTGILSRLFTPEQFGVVNIATVVIAFFAIFSDLGIGPAVIQHKNLDRHDLGGIFSLSVWSGAVMALLFSQQPARSPLSTAIRRCCATSCASSR